MSFSDPAPSGRNIPLLYRASGALFPSTKRPRADARGYLLSEGKAVAVGHCLPVVAEGLIPLIYRRAFFKHRATPMVIAPEEEGPSCYSCHDRDTQKASSLSKPRRSKTRLRIFRLSRMLFLLVRIQRSRMRIQQSSL